MLPSPGLTLESKVKMFEGLSSSEESSTTTSVVSLYPNVLEKEIPTQSTNNEHLDAESEPVIKRVTMDSLNIFPVSAIKLDVRELLERDFMGRGVLNSYICSRQLLPKDRKIITKLVVEDMMRQTSECKTNDFLYAGRKICESFPTEVIDVYIIPCSKTTCFNQARGKLVDKYRNMKSSARRRILSFHHEFAGNMYGSGSEREHPLDAEHSRHRSHGITLQAEIERTVKIFQNSKESETPPNTAATNTAAMVSLYSNVMEMERRNEESAEAERPAKRPHIDFYNPFPVSAIKLDVKGLLERDYMGRGVLNSYICNKQLIPKDRKIITKIVVEEMMRQTSECKTNDFLYAGSKICEVFPSEMMDIYIIPSGKNSSSNQARGKLVDKYRNMKSSARKRILAFQQDIPASSIPTSNYSHISETEEQITSEVEEKVRWLQSHCEPEDLLLSHWEATRGFRRRQWTAGAMQKKAADIMEKWPCLQLPIGSKLIEMDFAYLYPKETSSLHANWQIIRSNLITILKRRISDFSTQLMLDSLGGLEENSKDSIIFKLLMKQLKPCVITFSKRRKWHPSIAEAQDAFLVYLKNLADVDTHIKERREKLIAMELVMQPFGIVIGDESEMHNFLVYLDGIFYQANSLLGAIDLLFKIFKVFNIQYPIECPQIWTFIQQAIYKLYSKDDNQFPSVAELLSELMQFNH